MKLLFSFLILVVFFSLVFSVHAQVSTGNEIGTANLDKDKIFITRHFDEQLKIYGTLSEASRGTKITILITDPNGDPDPASQQIFTTDVGYFETFKVLNWESLRGTYTVHVSANSKIIGSLLFMVQESDEHTANIQTPKQIVHDSILTLEMTSSSDSIRVFPKYVDSFGNTLSFTIDGSEEFIEIYVDNQYIKSVKSNQWSKDIVVGYGTHDVYANSPEFTILNGAEKYLFAKSSVYSISLQSPTVSGLVADSAATTPFAVDESFAPKTVSVIIAAGSSSPGCETYNACYLPASITINTGDTVEWENIDTAAHTVTDGSPTDGPSGVFDSSLIMGGASFENTFDEVGRYDYFCMVHPWMTGLIIVQEAGVGKNIVNTGGKITHLETNSIEVIENLPVTLRGGSGTYGQSKYIWKQIGGEYVTLSANNVAEPQFMAPDVANGQIKVLTFTLIVTNTSGTIDSIIEIVVNPVNHIPMVSAGRDQDISKNLSPVTLVSSASDTDGDSLTYSWKQVAGQTLKLSNTHGKQITLLPSDIDYSKTDPITLQLTVDDGFGGSASDIVNIYPIPAKSNVPNISSQSSTISTSSGTQDQSLLIALGIIAVIGVIAGVIIMKRRKTPTIPGGTQTDDTQVWR